MQTRKGVDDALRHQIIKEHLSGASQYSLAKKYNLGSDHSITHWMRIFGIDKPSEEVNMVKSKESDEIIALKKELKETKACLAYQKKRADAYDKMIDIAEQKLNISIRKKAGTKR